LGFPWRRSPASHVFREGRSLADASKRYNRIFQHGTQMRSSEVTAKAPDSTAPPGVDYDMWLGPAPVGSFNPARYNSTASLALKQIS
jgi:hypothetical protein